MLQNFWDTLYIIECREHKSILRRQLEKISSESIDTITENLGPDPIDNLLFHFKHGFFNLMKSAGHRRHTYLPTTFQWTWVIMVKNP